MFAGRHICWAVDSLGDREELIASWARDGLDRGERVLCVEAQAREGFFLRCLDNHGIEWASPVRRGQLMVMAPERAHFADGRYDLNERMAAHAAFAEQSARQGYRALRMLGEAVDALTVVPGRSSLLEYEMHFDALCAACPMSVLCLYDRRTFGHDVARFVSAHPGAVADRQAQVFRRSATVTVTGEIDVSNADLVGALLGEIGEGGDVVVDMRGATFIDIGGAAELVKLAQRLAPDARVTIGSPPSCMEAILSACGWETELDLAIQGAPW